MLIIRIVRERDSTAVNLRGLCEHEESAAFRENASLMTYEDGEQN